MLDSTDPISQMAGEDSQFQQKMAIVELLDEENILIPSWICFSTIDGENVPSGDNFKDCLDIINRSKRVGAAGVNCAAPRFIEGLICKFEKLTDKAIAVYPNSGETWDAKAKFCCIFNSFGKNLPELSNKFITFALAILKDIICKIQKGDFLRNLRALKLYFEIVFFLINEHLRT